MPAEQAMVIWYQIDHVGHAIIVTAAAAATAVDISERVLQRPSEDTQQSTILHSQCTIYQTSDKDAIPLTASASL